MTRHSSTDAAMNRQSDVRHKATGKPVDAPRGTWRLAWGRMGYQQRSVLIDRRAMGANLLLALSLAMASVVYLSLGTLTVAPGELLSVLTGDGEPMASFMVRELRLPRLAVACMTGAAFALAGCLMQTLARNRLATPGIIGIDNGATAFAVASVVGIGVIVAPPAMALVGAATATALTFGLVGGGGVRGYRFIVTGIGVGAVFGALTQLLLARVSIDVANSAYPWTVGTLNARSPSAVVVLLIGLPVGILASLWLSRALSVMRFSELVAQGLGQPVSRRRHQALGLSVALTALAVAVAGPVGMVGLIGPEIARYLSSSRNVPILASALAGALVMVLSDLAGRTLFAPIEVPVGIVTAVVGAPYLLWILLRTSRSLA